MKISPVASGTGVPGMASGVTSQDRVSPEKIERAKQIAAGEEPQALSQQDPQVDRMQNMRRLKMKTNFSPDRAIEQPAEEPVVDAASPNPDTNVETKEPEVTQPLSPQFAALARQRRALQVKEQQIAEREKALSAQGESPETLVQKLKADPLSVLKENGVTYDQLTEAILAEQAGISPEVQKLQKRVEELESGIDKKLSTRDEQQEAAALREMEREAKLLVQDAETYKFISATNSIPDVMDLIKRTYKTSGEVLDVSDAMKLIETELQADFDSLQSKIKPKQPVQQQPAPGNKLIRTLTNRDSASPQMDRRSRAIAAAMGTLKR